MTKVYWNLYRRELNLYKSSMNYIIFTHLRKSYFPMSTKSYQGVWRKDTSRVAYDVDMNELCEAGSVDVIISFNAELDMSTRQKRSSLSVLPLFRGWSR